MKVCNVMKAMQISHFLLLRCRCSKKTCSQNNVVLLYADRLSVVLGRKRESERVYIGCMKKGPVVNDPALKW